MNMKLKKTGRPTKYTPGLGKRLARLIEYGCTLEEAAKEIGVHPATLYRWQNKQPALEADLREAMLRRDRFWYRVRRERWFPCPTAVIRVVDLVAHSRNGQTSLARPRA